MQKKLTHYLVILFVTATHLAQAQTPNTEKQKVIDFRKGGGTTEKKAIETDNYNDNRNVIWADALSTLFGFPSISYERRLLPSITAEVGGGVTVSGVSDANGAMLVVFAPQICRENKAYWEGLGYNDNDNDDFLINLYDIKSPRNNSTTPALGHHFFASAKYYFQHEDAFHGMYVGTRINYMRFNYQTLVPAKGLTNTPDFTATTEKANIYKTYLDFMPSLGFAQGAGHFALNYEFGIGVRSATLQGYDSAIKNTPAGYIQDYRLQTNIAIIPVVMATVKVGYAF